MIDAPAPISGPSNLGATSVPVTSGKSMGGMNFSFGGGNGGKTSDLFKRTDIGFALGLMAIILALVLPMPKWLLDASLALSITFSILILMTVLFSQNSLEFSSFPTILLVSTMLRLSLNVASTRLILADGHEGPQAAGEVIKAFGGFIMGNNYIIGIIVFIILVLVNFIVITKGSGRIAEVAARFTLDAMPGKQMAIDADLSAGLISEADARLRRKNLEDESSFFGAMDGAAKFVRGDAIAGILITFINIIAGMIIGIAQKGLDFQSAAQTYTLLTVGDGLVSQVPALIVSIAAGMLVSKAGNLGTTDQALVTQLFRNPTALWLSCFLMGCLALLPGTPKIPFVLLAAVMGLCASTVTKTLKAVKDKDILDKATTVQTKNQDDPPETALKMDDIRLELGYGLLSLVNSDNNRKLTDQIKSLRRQVAAETGFILPSVRIQDNLQLSPNAYTIKVKEISAGQGELRPHMSLIMDPAGNPLTLTGEHTKEPTFGLPAMWVNEDQRQEALNQGLTVVDASTVIITHLTELIKENLPDLMSYSETQKLLNELEKTHEKLVKDVIPTTVTISNVQRVLQNLLAERVSIRDLAAIVEGTAESTVYTRNLTNMTEYVRTRLSRQISNDNLDPNGVLLLTTLSPRWEKALNEALIGENENLQLALAPSLMQEFTFGIRDTFNKQVREGTNAVLLTSPRIRPYVRSIVERFRPQTVIMSQNEIHPKVRIKTVGQIE